MKVIYLYMTTLLLSFTLAYLFSACKPEMKKAEDTFDFKKYRDGILAIDTFVDIIDYYEDFDILRLKGIRPTKSLHSFVNNTLLKGFFRINENEFVLFIVGKETNFDKIYHFPIFFNKIGDGIFKGELYSKSRHSQRFFYLNLDKFIITGDDNFPDNLSYCYADSDHVKIYGSILSDNLQDLLVKFESHKPKVEFNYFYEKDSIRLENVIPKNKKQKILEVGRNNLYFILTNT